MDIDGQASRIAGVPEGGRLRTEEQLRLYRAIVTSCGDAVAIYDHDGRLLEQNPAHERLFGYRIEELQGHTVALLCGDECDGRIVADLAAGGSYRGQIECRTRDGRTVQVELSVFPVRAGDGGVPFRVGLARDVTARRREPARRQVFQQLREEILRMRVGDDIDDLLTALGAGLPRMGIDCTDCRVHLLDTSTDPPGLRSRSLRPGAGWVTVADPLAVREVERCRRAGAPVHGRDLLAEDPDGESVCPGGRPPIRSVVELPFPQGTLALDSTRPDAFSGDDLALLREVAGVLASGFQRAEDLRQLACARRELREQRSCLAQSEKMAALGNLAAGIAHEINTPVGAIHSVHDTLRRAVARLKESMEAEHPGCLAGDTALAGALKVVEESTRVIESGSVRVTDIVRSLRNFTRLDPAEPREVDLHEGLEDSLMLVSHDLKNRVVVERDYGDVPRVVCYPGRLNQVFLNILNNAQQAIEGRGTITVRTRRAGDEVHVSVTDTGAGIPQDALSLIFDSGYTTKGVGVGTGLGLSICHRILADHGGRIDVTSQVGKGSTFTLVVPIAPPHEPQIPPS